MPDRNPRFLFGSIQLHTRKPGKAGISLAVFRAGIIIIIMMICLSVLVRKIEASDNLAFDMASFEWLDGFRSSMLTHFFIVITFLGTGSFLIPMYIFLTSCCIYKKKPEQARTITVVAFSSVLLGWALKPVFHRTRPVQPLVSGAGGSSFPSGHALGAFTFSLLIIYLISQSKKPAAVKYLLCFCSLAFCFLVAASRVYLHVHFASDVTGSLLIAVEWCAFLFIIMTQIRRR